MVKCFKSSGKNYFDVSAGQLFAVVNFRASLAPFHHSNAIIPPNAASPNIGEIAAAFAAVNAVPAMPVFAAPAATVASAIIFLLFQWLALFLSVERNKKRTVQLVRKLTKIFC
jgi:hypothetical protein